MTATPRIYTDSVKQKAGQHNIGVFSMDDDAHYGKEFFRLGFSTAVENGMLSDYRVIILTITEDHVIDSLSKLDKEKIADIDPKTDDAAKIIGCYKALRDQGEGDKGIRLKRAVSFSNSIKNSEIVVEKFASIVKVLNDAENDNFTVDLKHVDGRQSALKRSGKLDWLRADAQTDEGDSVCRILSNAKCLTEGVDVPSLDAILFMNPRRSQIDVVQAVGRVMRSAPGKKYGYVILPVVIPAGKNIEDSLNKNTTFSVVWEVLRALRAHDDRLTNIVSKLELNNRLPDDKKITVISVGGTGDNEPKGDDGTKERDKKTIKQMVFAFPEPLAPLIHAKIVEKVGDRHYLEHWAKDTAELHDLLVERINTLRQNHREVEEVYESFINSLHASINDGIGKTVATSMLAQQLITKPIFDALFENYKFNETNPVSISLDKVLKVLKDYGLDTELKKLSRFYKSVKDRISGLDNDEARQTVITELYEKFFTTAFHKISKSLGIAYTPIELVDFTLASADYALRNEFGRSLSDEGVHIIDPFTGTGSFIVRLLQNTNLIKDKDLHRKFTSELWANEILLLAYYIACVNIEMAFHQRSSSNYKSFPGISLTDSFESYKSRQSYLPGFLSENNKRIEGQIKSSIQVVVGNPPWSAREKEDMNNPRREYEYLDGDIRQTYAKRSTAKNLNPLYDYYIRAICFASARIDEKCGGVIALVTNSGWLDGTSMDGMRLCLEEEFDAIWIFDLRGNINKNIESRGAAREGDNVFDSKSKSGVCINIFVKNPNKKQKKAEIRYHDIGDDLKCKEKLGKISQFISIEGLKSWNHIIPNREGDWVKQRDPIFENLIELGNHNVKNTKTAQPETIFISYSGGLKTNRDAWAYNFNRNKVANHMQKMIDVYNEQCEILAKARKNNPNINLNLVLDANSNRISWDSTLRLDVIKNKKGSFDTTKIVPALYRPFTIEYLYFDRQFNNSVHHQPSYFPKSNKENRVICITGNGAVQFACLITDHIPDVNLFTPTQTFPRYTYQKDIKTGEIQQNDNITDYSLKHFRASYSDQTITKDNIFDYVYGILHASDYRERFVVNLRVGLPRIPIATDFWAFAKAGARLTELHLGWRLDGDPSATTDLGLQFKNNPNFPDMIDDAYWHVKKMKLEEKDSQLFVIYNQYIKIGPIPSESTQYTLCNRTPLEWVINRYKEKIDKPSQITNNPNDWITEQKTADALFQLIKRVTYLSTESAKVIKNLPKSAQKDQK